MGDVEPLTESDVVGRSREGLKDDQSGVLAAYTPYTERLFERLKALKPERLAIIHGLSLAGDGAQTLRDLAVVFKETFGKP